MLNREQEHLTAPQIAQMVKKIVKEVELLQKTIDRQPVKDSQTISGVIFRQKKALMKLFKMATDGSMIAGIGYIKACCISGYHVDYIFNYRDNYIDKTGASYIQTLFEPQKLIPFLLKQNILKKVHSIISFALDLPDLTDKSFSTVLYDAIQYQNEQGQTFGEQLADKLQEAYNQSVTSTSTFEQNSVIQTIKLLSERGYAPVQNLYASILYKTNHFEESRQVYQSVLRNKYARISDIQQARESLRLKTPPIFIRSIHTQAENS